MDWFLDDEGLRHVRVKVTIWRCKQKIYQSHYGL